MKRRLLIALCLLCMLMNLLVFSVSAETSGDCGDNATWSLSDDGVLTISGSGAIRDYIYEGANLWPNIKAPWRKDASKIKKVVISSGITRIGDNAFCCLPNVTSVSIANTVTSIGQAAFCDMKALTQITIPESVADIEKSAFKQCKSLKTVKLPGSMKILPEGMFEGCFALKSIDLPKGITEIQWSAFRGTGLTSIVIPEKVTSIKASAFENCIDLRTVKLPSGLKEIGMQVFSNSGITSIILPASIQSIGRAFVWCHSLKSVRFEGSAPQIDNYAFDDVTATVYYPKDNTTWTESVRKDYDGTLSWIAYCGNGHTWGPWKIERESTCAVSGLNVRRCTQCDMTEEESLAKTAHQYSSVVTPPTCKDDGFTTHTCIVCNASYIDNKTSAGLHAFGEWVIVEESNCLEKGKRQRDCIVCSLREEEEIEISGHAYRDEVTAPSCTKRGFSTHICTVCEHTVVDTYMEPTGHSYGEWMEIQSASWMAEGEQYRKCIDCAAEQTEIIPKLPINWWLVVGIVLVSIVIGAGVVAIVVAKRKHCTK